MITGDHKLTAQAIAQQLGIIQNGADGVALSGTELDQLTPEQLQETVKTVSVYARVSPEHKLRVVEALQKNDHIVAMTGDGVNDAPALRQANIGVAMGITGTDVSKGAADMVLTDDNFASIVSAVEEGRTIYDNIRKFLRYLMGSNMGEILAMFGAIVIGFKLPLVATQILWVNLVTDGLPAIALGFEPAEPGVMDRPPRPPKESIFARGVGIHVLWAGFWMGMVTLISFIYMLDKYGGEIWDPLDADLTMARSMAFFVLATTQVFHVTAIHAGHASFFKAPVWRNRILMFAIALTIALQVGAIYLPFMNTLLDTEPLELEEFALAFVFAASILPAVEIEKAFWRRREAAQQAETPPLPDSM
jgi:Ca2+-transporting ATPase